jgi:Domain of unknown function (DUF1839)
MSAVPTQALRVLPGVQAGAYRPHALHGDTQVWVEKNCYADVWIELLHSMGLEPHAMLPFVLAVDFEGDQWTFFKPPPGDLWALYGVDVQELTVWRPLAEHLQEHLGAGKLVSVEVDAHWLPDVAGTDYRSQHTKTTIVVNEFDVAAQRLGYFHNAGYHALDGEDCRRLLHLDAPDDPERLPLFAELVQVDRAQRLPPEDLRLRSARLLSDHLARRPATNPLPRFAERFAVELPLLQARGLAHYHAWAFATIRQCGAAFDLAAAHLRWRAGLGAADATDATAAAAAFDRIATGCKALILKVARAVNSGRALDATATFDDMALAWEDGMAATGRVAAAEGTAGSSY